jgi:hypothetical protein
MKDRQPCQSEAEARLSSGSAIAVPAITISLEKQPLDCQATSTRRAHSRRSRCRSDAGAAWLADLPLPFNLRSLARYVCPKAAAQAVCSMYVKLELFAFGQTTFVWLARSCRRAAGRTSA